ncbi:MAG: UDP-N-acetylmuramoyl-tripeptide--D-alanyl-D-alanine ligase [Bacteroidia bacterium]|nr:UDP-N-acetylmuramoyl-tripeptide--D-alanyl-D-alanine ligase [Bacteroidia bacterium]
MNIETLHQVFLSSNAICTDSRKLKKNDLFFALKGDNFNGNLFAEEAIDKGAAYAVIDESDHKDGEQFILVDNALETLQKLANYHRNKLGLKIIALTGSNGKTTTKELIHTVLKEQFNTVATIGNLNNHIGVPLTLLSMNDTTEIGIVEMGANHLDEIKFLCEITEPNYGYITNFGKAHLEGFGSIEGVIKGKSELYEYLKSSSGLVFINANDPVQTKFSSTYENTVIFNSDQRNGLFIELIGVDPFVNIVFEEIAMKSQLIGAYNYNNISAAIAIGHYFGIETENIKHAIENYMPVNMRSQLIDRGNNTIILDAYNANPSSMKAALDHFSKLRNGHKVAILGDMFELGNAARTEHESIANYAVELGIEKIILVGKNFFECDTTADKIVKFETFEELERNFGGFDFSNSSFLIKGSRGMALERVVDFIH